MIITYKVKVILPDFLHHVFATYHAFNYQGGHMANTWNSNLLTNRRNRFIASTLGSHVQIFCFVYSKQDSVLKLFCFWINKRKNLNVSSKFQGRESVSPLCKLIGVGKLWFIFVIINFTLLTLLGLTSHHPMFVVCIELRNSQEVVPKSACNVTAIDVWNGEIWLESNLI